ncbi:MAG: C40 family peptidase [Zoogloeaceae bacterium]|jgi:cell wall-associated NlpC family hydrolase|nr:C40 family peptidase [Zoogloeaceae bacterium]
MFKSCKTFLFIFSVSASVIFPSSALAEDVTRHDAEESLFARYSNTTQDVILKALELVGVRYRMGGDDPLVGLDCSSFVRLVYRDAIDLVLPRTAHEQSRMGAEVAKRTELKPGDLVFFNTARRAFSHVGIYLGDNYFLHAPSSGGTVRVESMQKRYWLTRYNGARRLIAGKRPD